jgi:hypothetical protein
MARIKKPKYKIGDFIKYPKALIYGEIISIKFNTYLKEYEYKVLYADGKVVTITDGDNPIKKTVNPQNANKMATKKKTKAPTAAQKAARAKFAVKAKKAAALVKSGKARNMKAAWKQIK